jgi:hypothetical protein
MEALRTMIKGKHSSLAAAVRVSDPLWKDFQELYATYKSIIKAATKRVFKDE